MIDMHSHILPGIDDGARYIQETQKLIGEAEKSGFEAIVTTPHYMENYYEVDEAKRKELINNVETKMKLYIGNEIYLSENIIKLVEEKKASTINNTKYILFEMPMNTKPMNVYDAVYEMLQSKYIPILAHPERYIFVQKDPSLICDLIQNGVLMQANYGSIIGEYGSKAQMLVQAFFRNNMIHFLGTDAHKSNTIYPKIPQIVNKLEKLIGKNQFERLSKINPNLVIENKEIDYEIIEEMKFTLKEKLILKL